MKQPQARIAAEGGLLQNKAYLALMASQLISNLGDWLHILALLTMIGLKWEATPWQITATMLCMLIPMLLGGPAAGVLADRMERKKLMIVADVVRFVIVLGLVFVTHLWQVYALLIAKSVFDVLFSPAKNGKIKEVVPPEHMEKAVSYSAIIEQGSKIIGPALGGMLTVAFGITSCFMIDAASFLLSGLILLAVPGRRTEAGSSAEVDNPGEKPGFWGELTEGVKAIARIPLIAFGLLMLAMALLILQVADSQTVVLFREIPGMPEDMLGWCIALSGFGTLAAAGVNGLLRRSTPLVKMGTGGVLLGAVFAGAGYFAVSGGLLGASGHALMLALYFLAGTGAGLVFIPFQVTLQQRTPESLTGRVFGTVTSVTSAAAVAGPMFGGYIVTAFGPAPAFILSGGLMVLLACLLLIFKSMIMKRDRSSVQQQQAVGHY
ncbi:MFS transporter [Paenibacillus faecis]|uniref:MFS transporter n=1 Tax=Paenibacillus faecis TaxID=862114 RepID=UPI001BCF3C83|nr:MFS transporter [Paenibacillus faecis]